jgi:hypothetical protein
MPGCGRFGVAASLSPRRSPTGKLPPGPWGLFLCGLWQRHPLPHRVPSPLPAVSLRTVVGAGMPALVAVTMAGGLLTMTP